MSTRTKTYASAALNDTDGVKTSAATLTSPVEFDAEDLVNGGVLDFPRTITVTSGANTGAYAVVDPIVVTGLYGGQVVTQELQLTAANGNETIFGDQPFDHVTSIEVPAQADTDGTLQFGVGDICAPAGDKFTAVQVDTAVTVHLRFDGALTDAIALAAKTKLDVAFTRVGTGTGETSGAAVTVFHG